MDVLLLRKIYGAGCGSGHQHVPDFVANICDREFFVFLSLVDSGMLWILFFEPRNTTSGFKSPIR